VETPVDGRAGVDGRLGGIGVAVPSTIIIRPRAIRITARRTPAVGRTSKRLFGGGGVGRRFRFGRGFAAGPGPVVAADLLQDFRVAGGGATAGGIGGVGRFGFGHALIVTRFR